VDWDIRPEGENPPPDLPRYAIVCKKSKLENL